MNNEELQKYSQEVIDKCKPLFEIVKEICDFLIKNPNIDNYDIYSQYLNQITGIFGFLNTEYKHISALKENTEANYFNSLKLQADVEGNKFIAEVAKRQASEYVKDLRIARNILEGYVEICSRLIDTCKIQLYDKKNILKGENI